MNLKSPSIILYFFSYILYLFFFRLVEDKEIALVFKPMIIASIFFYYFFSNKTVKKEKLHFLILGILFIADNVNLLMETIFYQMALSLYLVVLSIFLYQILKDSKLIKENSKFGRYLGLAFFIGVLAFLILKVVSIYIVTNKFHSYYFITNYIVVFVCVLIFSIYNYFKHKTVSSKYLLLTLLTLFISDLFFVTNAYYYKNKIILALACLVEVPCYYFLVNYFINRDVEKNKLHNNISS